MKKIYEITVRLYGDCCKTIYTYDLRGIQEERVCTATQDCVMIIDADSHDDAIEMAMTYAKSDTGDLNNIDKVELYDVRFIGEALDMKRNCICDVRYEDVDL